MKQRLPLDIFPEAQKALRALEQELGRVSLDRNLIELVKLRVSMINGCAYCVELHFEALRKRGEKEPRLYGLSTWREQGGYTPVERAALAWAESVTLVSSTHVPDSAYAEVREYFSERELGELTYAIAAINSWNRLCVAFRAQPKWLTKADGES
jgi:AhpD family alkylhydroperoxidase